MLALLVSIRDFLIALALAWVGVCLEARHTSTSACTSDACSSVHEAR
jgi:hypothetical protein